MIEFEDILDDASRYLRGEMPEDERSVFEELLDIYPHLREEMIFFQRVRLGLQQLKEKNEVLIVKKRKNFKHYKQAMAVFLLLLLAVLPFFFSKKKILSPSEPPGIVRVGQLNQSQSIIIERGGGDSQNTYSDYGWSVAWTHTGDIALASMFAGNARLGSETFRSIGAHDMLFGVYRLNEGPQWLIPLGSKGEKSEARDIVIDQEENLILCGSFGGAVNFGYGAVSAIGRDDWGNRDFFIAKYDLSGQLIWLDHAGGQRIANKQTGLNMGMSVAVDAENNVLATGTYLGSPKLGGGSLPEGGPNEDLFLAKYRSDGALLWSKTVTCDYMISPWGVAADQQNNIYVCGRFGHHNLSGTAYFDNIHLKSYGGRDVFLAKYDPEGRLLWARQAGSALVPGGDDMCSNLAVDPDGNILITGRFVGEARFDTLKIVSFGERDIFLAKYNSDGRILWLAQSGSDQGNKYHVEQANDVKVDETGNSIVTGTFTGKCRFGNQTVTSNGKSDCFIAKYSPEGKLRWVKQLGKYGNIEDATGQGIDIDANGNIVVTGFFSGTIRLQEYELTSVGKVDIFILVFNEIGELLTASSPLIYN